MENDKKRHIREWEKRVANREKTSLLFVKEADRVGVDQLPYKEFRPHDRDKPPGEIHRGDCTIQNGIFRFYSDGSTHWECNISSTDGGDEWDGSICGGRVGYDGEIGTIDLALFCVIPAYHFNISDSNTVKRWIQDEGPDQILDVTDIGVAEIYQSLAVVAFSCNC